MDESKKKALLQIARRLREVGTRDDMQKAMDMYKAAGYGPKHSTKETTEAGRKFLTAKRDMDNPIRVPGTPEKIDTISRQEIASPSDVDAKVAAHRAKRAALKQVAGGDRGLRKALTGALGKMGKRGLKAIPLVGGAISAITSGDAAAALPILGDADEVGRGSDQPTGEMMSPEEMLRLAEEYNKERGE